jgi:thiol-disulfide isomerase/thioredoxin
MQPETFFVAWLQDPETPDEASDIDRSVSPYAPRAGLSNAELIDFIFDMQDKPTSIQRRPGFAEAIALAADRILAGQPTDKHCELAAEAKFAALHAAACQGDEGADQQLAEFAKQMRDHRLKKIADRAQFFLLEQKTVQADELPLDAIPALLEELAAYLADRSLDESHLRLASSTVHAINRLEDEDQREEYFQKFGETFAKSSSKDLARYGKKLAKSPEQKQPDLIGKPLELAGVTALGTKLDWESYRGKVVLVDFWATWCGPCRKAMPEVKAHYDQLHERGFDIVGISLDRTAEALAKYLDENEIVWTNVFGEDATKLAERYGVRGIPMMMLVDRQGTVVAAGHQLEPLKAKIMELLNES